MNASPLKKYLLYFSFLYFFLFATPLTALLLTYFLTPLSSGSGDQTFHYALLLVNLIFAAVAALFWLFFDQKNHEKLPKILWTCCRYYLSFVMMGYGMCKVLPIQFSSPHLTDLITPLGQSSPMGLVWKMMGYSYAYSFFTGVAEVAGSVLLLFRRTTTLGALILTAVLSNVVMLNLCYDIPVKQLSIHLLLFSIAILIPDRKRLAALLMDPFNSESSSFRKRRLAAKVCFALASAATIFTFRPENPAEPPLYGIFEVVAYQKGEQTLLPLLTDKDYMRYFVFDKGYAVIRRMDEQSESFETKFDAGKVFLNKNAFDYHFVENQLVLTGEFEGEQVLLTLKKKALDDFLLLNRGFHWINEFPLNK